MRQYLPAHCKWLTKHATSAGFDCKSIFECNVWTLNTISLIHLVYSVNLMPSSCCWLAKRLSLIWMKIKSTVYDLWRAFVLFLRKNLWKSFSKTIPLSLRYALFARLYLDFLWALRRWLVYLQCKHSFCKQIKVHKTVNLNLEHFYATFLALFIAHWLPFSALLVKWTENLFKSINAGKWYFVQLLLLFILPFKKFCINERCQLFNVVIRHLNEIWHRTIKIWM